MSKICYICDTFPSLHKSWSGAELACQYVMESYKGKKVLLTSKIDNFRSKNFENRNFKNKNFEIYILPKSFSKNLLVNPLIIQKLFFLFSKIKPDIVHFFTKKYLVPAWLVAKIMNITMIYSVVDYHIFCPNNILKRKDSKLCYVGPGVFCQNCWYSKFIFPFNYLFSILRFIIFKKIINDIQLFITFTNTSKWRMTYYGVPSKKIKVVFQHKLPKNIPDIELPFKSIVFVGYCSPPKGVHIVIAALKHIVKENSNIMLYIVGDGDKKYLEYLYDLIRCFNIEKNVTFLGKLDHIDALAMLKAADVAVVAEQWFSDFGNLVVVEALQLGTPIVCSDLGSAKEYTDVFIAFRNDPLAYKRAILQALKQGRTKTQNVLPKLNIKKIYKEVKK